MNGERQENCLKIHIVVVALVSFPPMAAIFDSIEKGLAEWGFDLCQPFAGGARGRLLRVVEDYNDNVSDVNKIPSMGRETTLAVLVGKTLNNPFISRQFEKHMGAFHCRARQG